MKNNHAIKKRNLDQITIENAPNKTHRFINKGLFSSLILSRLNKAEYGSIKLTLPNTKTIWHEGPKQGQDVDICFNNWKSVFRLMFLGELSFAEAYIRGEIQIADLRALFLWYIDNEEKTVKKQNNIFISIFNRFSHVLLKDNSKSGSKKNISFHYDLGNEFYQEWLDASMTYSAGIFDKGDCLQKAQDAKYARIVAQLDIKDGSSLLEIGCGWGGFANHVLKQYSLDYRGITISAKQLEYAKQQLEQASITSAQMVFEDYRETSGQYDNIVSIEMFEAVGEKHWPSYFETIKKRLKPNGVAVIQVITIDHERFLKYRNQVDFIQKYIFPGGMLPSKRVFDQQVKQADLRIIDGFAFGHDYAKTLELWKENFINKWPKLEGLGFDQKFYRLWLYYLDYCIAGFEGGAIDVMQYTIRHKEPTHKVNEPFIIGEK